MDQIGVVSFINLSEWEIKFDKLLLSHSHTQDHEVSETNMHVNM